MGLITLRVFAQRPSLILFNSLLLNLGKSGLEMSSVSVSQQLLAVPFGVQGAYVGTPHFHGDLVSWGERQGERAAGRENWERG